MSITSQLYEHLELTWLTSHERQSRRKHVWQLQEAKARLCDLIRSAVVDGPQEITLRGKPAVVLSRADYDKMCGSGKAQSLVISNPWEQ